MSGLQGVCQLLDVVVKLQAAMVESEVVNPSDLRFFHLQDDLAENGF